MIEVTCAIIIHEGKVLVTQRSADMPHPFKWEFPGGKLKTGESPEKCINREIREELGISIRAEQLMPSVLHNYDYNSIKLIPFICSYHGGNIVLKEHRSYRWVDISKLDTLDWLEADIKIVNRLDRSSLMTY